jgi:hypothetical protein
MKITVLILTLFLSYSLKSQIPVEAFTDALKTKQYSIFEKVFKKALKEDKLIDYSNSLSREIFEDYKEVYYDIFDKYPLEGNNHSLKIIVKGNKIIYYHFSFVNVERQAEKRIFTTVPIDTFIDVSKYNALKTEFRKVYEADLNETDLWTFKIVGQFCGLRITLENIKDYDEMNSLVNSNKRDSLLKWLQSANLEKQMFGLWGYNILIQKQMTLSTLELKLIKVVMTKKAKGNVCGGGCEVYHLTPKEFMKRYNLNELPD